MNDLVGASVAAVIAGFDGDERCACDETEHAAPAGGGLGGHKAGNLMGDHERGLGCGGGTSVGSFSQGFAPDWAMRATLSFREMESWRRSSDSIVQWPLSSKVSVTERTPADFLRILVGAVFCNGRRADSTS